MRKVIMGIDPGTNHTGWAIISDGRLLDYGEIVSKSLWTNSRKLLNIHETLINKAEQCQVSTVACEDQHLNSRYVSAIKALSKVRGVIELIAAQIVADLVIFLPSEHKPTTVGSGNATKEDTISAVSKLFGISNISDNIADAISIAYTCYKTKVE